MRKLVVLLTVAALVSGVTAVLAGCGSSAPAGQPVSADYGDRVATPDDYRSAHGDRSATPQALCDARGDRSATPEAHRYRICSSSG